MVHASLRPCEPAPSVTHKPSDVTWQYSGPDVMVHHCACCNRRDGPPSLLKSKIAVCAATPRGSTASTIANANPCDAIGHLRRARDLPHRRTRLAATPQPKRVARQSLARANIIVASAAVGREAIIASLVSVVSVSENSPCGVRFPASLKLAGREIAI